MINAGCHIRRHRTSYRIRSIDSWMDWGTATVLCRYQPASHLLRFWRLISTLCLRATLLLRIGEEYLLRGASDYYSRGPRNREMDPWRSVPGYIRTVLAILSLPGSVTVLLCLKVRSLQCNRVAKRGMKKWYASKYKKTLVGISICQSSTEILVSVTTASYQLWVPS